MSKLATFAKTNLRTAQINLANARAQYDGAKTNLDNATKLYKAAVVLSDSAASETSSQKLCALCTKINFNALFKYHGRGWKTGSTVRRAIGNLFNTVENQFTCLSCRFLLEACQLGRAPGQLCLHALAEAKDVTIYLSEDPEGKPWYTKAGIAANFPPIPYLWIQVGLPSKTGEPHVCIVLEPSYDEEDALNIPQQHNSGSFPRTRDHVEAFNGSMNIEAIQVWLATCDQHDVRCVGRISCAFVYYLIDVDTRHIVQFSGYCRYVTLSYVWGKGAKSIHQRERTEESPDSLGGSPIGWKVPYPAAQTIEDAMTLVKNLGERYLWADLYCIDQNDELAKQEQITLMDKIYASSYLTIVALDGENADWGLPGITRPLEHTKQPTLTLDHGVLRATYVFSIYDHLGDSKWDSRAWTLQERLLSPRCIIFARSSISMRCVREVFHDSMRVDTTNTRPRVLTKLGEEQYWEDGSTIDLTETEWDYKHYDSFISAYTSRDLTDQSDALNACRGILNMITKNTGQAFVFGLPVQDFHRALLWKPHHDNTLTRRRAFPSWSWAGWIGRTEHAYWVGDMADYANEGARRLNKRVRGAEPLDPMPDISADIQYLPRTEADGELIRVFSQVATFYLCLQRRDGEVHSGLKSKSLQPTYAVGDHWTLMAGQSGPRKLRNTAGGYEVFENTDVFFRTHPEFRTTLERFANGHDRAEFLLVATWPRLRDSKASNKWCENMVSALLIYPRSDGKYERLASILLPWHEWEAAKPHSRLVELV